MELDNILTEEVDVFDVSENENFPFAKTWKKTYEAIEWSLNGFGEPDEKERILRKVSHIVNVLVRFGTTYEDLVLETAEVYVFSKEANLNAEDFEKSYGKYVVEGIKALNQPLSTKAKMKEVFENKEYKYLGKIKIAEYLVDLVLNESISNEYLKEIDDVIKVYENRVHKNLMKMLKEEREKRK